jgi:hypothetical protein
MQKDMENEINKLVETLLASSGVATLDSELKQLIMLQFVLMKFYTSTDNKEFKSAIEAYMMKMLIASKE